MGTETCALNMSMTTSGKYILPYATTIIQASTLVIADVSHGSIKQSFASCMAAAAQLGGTVDALICGKNVDGAAQDASFVSHVQKVLTADHTALEHHLAEPMSALLCKVMDRYVTTQWNIC